MSRYAVVLGDTTSHGGRVISASATLDVFGKRVALFNDQVSCPLHGTNKIIDADNRVYEEQGRGIVLHGSQTECGATVYAQYTDIEVF